MRTPSSNWQLVRSGNFLGWAACLHYAYFDLCCCQSLLRAPNTLLLLQLYVYVRGCVQSSASILTWGSSSWNASSTSIVLSHARNIKKMKSTSRGIVRSHSFAQPPLPLLRSGNGMPMLGKGTRFEVLLFMGCCNLAARRRIKPWRQYDGPLNIWTEARLTTGGSGTNQVPVPGRLY